MLCLKRTTSKMNLYNNKDKKYIISAAEINFNYTENLLVTSLNTNRESPTTLFFYFSFHQKYYWVFVAALFIIFIAQE